jgi:hypothetical protein
MLRAERACKLFWKTSEKLVTIKGSLGGQGLESTLGDRIHSESGGRCCGRSAAPLNGSTTSDLLTQRVSARELSPENGKLARKASSSCDGLPRMVRGSLHDT